jgi:hypothetical protein
MGKSLAETWISTPVGIALMQLSIMNPALNRAESLPRVHRRLFGALRDTEA